MRKYQRKAVHELAELYQSNDPLKWVYIANKLGVTYIMSDREKRIMFRRFTKSFKNMAKFIGKVFDQVLTTVQEAVAGLVAFANATGVNANEINRLTVPPAALQMPERPMLGMNADLVIIDEEIPNENR